MVIIPPCILYTDVASSVHQELQLRGLPSEKTQPAVYFSPGSIDSSSPLSLPTVSAQFAALPTHCGLPDIQSVVAHTGTNTQPDEASAPNSSVVIAHPQYSVSTAVCGRLPVPYRFPVSNIRPALITAINNGEHLETKQRSEVMEAVYVDVTKHTLYALSIVTCIYHSVKCYFFFCSKMYWSALHASQSAVHKFCSYCPNALPMQVHF